MNKLLCAVALFGVLTGFGKLTPWRIFPIDFHAPQTGGLLFSIATYECNRQIAQSA